MTNRTAWATAKEARARTIRAAKAVLITLQREGIAGYCSHSDAFENLIETAEMPVALASEFPSNYWNFYCKEPEEHDATAFVKQMEADCRRIAAQPLPNLARR